MRAFLRRMLPERLRITHGHIVSASSPDQEPRVSPQVDVIISDTLVPHSLWVIDDLQGSELVPLEAVLGVLEIKRTLTSKSLRGAIDQLQDIRNSVSLPKYDDSKFLPGGSPVGPSLSSPYRSNPLLGVIGMTADDWFNEDPSQRVTDVVSLASAGQAAPALELDVVLSLDGSLVATTTRSGSAGYGVHNPRETGRHYGWHECSSRLGQPPSAAAAFGVGFLLAYLSTACGRQMDTQNYFFNSSLGGA